MSIPFSCFTAYDVRGKIPDEFDEHIALRIALAFARFCDIHTVVVGRDMRLTSPIIAETIIAGLLAQGVDVIDIGLCGTEEVYHAVFSGAAAGVEGGIMITASHNPAEYNGMKIVQREARPVSSDSGLVEIARMAGDADWVQSVMAQGAPRRGNCTQACRQEGLHRPSSGHSRLPGDATDEAGGERRQRLCRTDR